MMNLSCTDGTCFNQRRAFPRKFADQAGLAKAVLVIIDPEFYHIAPSASRLPARSFTGFYHAQAAQYRQKPDPRIGAAAESGQSSWLYYGRYRYWQDGDFASNGASLVGHWRTGIHGRCQR